MKVKRMQSIVTMLCNFHNIRLTWKKSDAEGICWQHLREIRIAPILGKLDFWVALHEIGHIVADITGVLDTKTPLYMSEYAASMYAINMMAQLDIDLKIYKEHARRYQIWVIADEINKKHLNVKDIHPEVIAFCNIDFSQWIGAKNIRIVNKLKYPHKKYPLIVQLSK